MPVTAGPLTVVYPKWIPASSMARPWADRKHGRIFYHGENGQPVKWERDKVDCSPTI